VHADQNRFEQIFINFVSNALKFTNQNGQVEISLESKNIEKAEKNKVDEAQSSRKRRGSQKVNRECNVLDSCEEADQYYHHFEIKIIDNGQGISEEGIKKLFVDFSSLKEHRGVNHSGTGLGLSICKQIIVKMGGTVSVTSQVGVGTTFTIDIRCLCRVS